MSNGVAPVCPISNSQPTQTTPGIPPATLPRGVTIPKIPRATNLISVINALNVINNVVHQVTVGTPAINNVYPPKTVDLRQPFPGYLRGNWSEVGRNYFSQKVVNPDDHTQSVTLNTIGFVEWQENETGHTLVYQGH